MAVVGLLHTRTVQVAQGFEERIRTVGEVGEGEKERVISIKKGHSAMSGDIESAGCLHGLPHKIYFPNEGVWTSGELLKKLKDSKMQFES